MEKEREDEPSPSPLQPMMSSITMEKEREDEPSPSPLQPTQRKKSYRGILAMIMGPPKTSSLSSSTQSSHYGLGYHPLEKSTSARLIKRPSSRRRRKHRGDVESNTTSVYVVPPPLKLFDPHQAEFTLLFFCDFNCRNTIRFVPILAEFLKNCSDAIGQTSHRVDDDNDHGGNGGNDSVISPFLEQEEVVVKACTSSLSMPYCRLICIPNNEISTEDMTTDNVYHNYSNNEMMGFFSYLISQTEFWHLGYDHANRLGIIRLLAVAVVPTLIIINNNNGKIVSNRGMEAIEYNQHCSPNIVVDAWRNGENPIPVLARITSGCEIT